MGFAVQNFVVQPDANLLCGVCSSVLENAVLTRCGHCFCEVCLDTWIESHETCPICRLSVRKCQVSPIWSIRSIVLGLSVQCDNASLGCKLVMKLENIGSHLESCAYSAIECAGCGSSISRYQLSSHQLQCPPLVGDDDGENDSELSAISGELTRRRMIMDIQYKRTKRELEAAEAKNRKLERELAKIKSALEEKRDECELLNSQLNDFDADYSYGYAPESVAQLSLLIARYLLNKPSYIDRDRIFNCLKRCYENYARCGDEYEHDVQMLISTAFASDWFSESQRINIQCWLQSISRYRKYADLHNTTNRSINRINRNR